MELGRPLVFGEILFDRFPDGASRLGGAPLNVAVHLASPGADPLLVSRVGRDAGGERAVAVVYHGVLGARAERSRAALDALRAALPLPRVVDVNLRPPRTPVERALALAQGASWIKANREELGRLLERAPPRDEAELAIDAHGLLFRPAGGALVVTDGARAVHQFGSAGEHRRVQSPRLSAEDLVDSVSAGDAFAAVLVFGVLAAWPAERTLARAAELAAAVCTLPGALPTPGDLHAAFRDAWGLAA